MELASAYSSIAKNFSYQSKLLNCYVLGFGKSLEDLGLYQSGKLLIDNFLLVERVQEIAQLGAFKFVNLRDNSRLQN